MAELRLVCCGVSAEWLGSETLSIDTGGARTAAELLDLLTRRFPDFAGHRNSVVLAAGDRVLADGASLDRLDELALIPPVSGG